MRQLLSFREATRIFYAKYDTYLISAWKFLIAFVSFILINGKLGYFAKLDSIFLVIILALFCSFMPVNTIVLIGTVLILGHLYGLSLAALAAGGGILAILLLIYMGTVPQTGYVLILTMLALALKLPCAVSLVFGLISGPMSLAAICFGTVAYYTVVAVNEAAQSGAALENISAAEESQELVENIRMLLDGIMNENRMVLMLISLAAAFLVVWVVRKMAVAHAWSLAIGLGTLVFFVTDMMGCMLFGNLSEIPGLVVGTVVSVLIAIAVKFMIFHVDYERTLNLQFEDSDYYYYVKAVPKIKKGSDISGNN